MTINEIFRGLQGRNVRLVAKITGLHYHTIRNIKRGEHKNITENTRETLERFLRMYPFGQYIERDGSYVEVDGDA